MVKLTNAERRLIARATPLTHERLLQLLDYNPWTGVFTRRARSGSGARKAGEIAGGPHCQGYWVICVDYTHYLAHRLAWFYVNGEWPDQLIDHRNRNKRDNRYSNLRKATHSQNLSNNDPKTKNASGFKGVHRNSKTTGKPWRAVISSNNRQIHIGSFDTPEQAYEAYCNFGIGLRGEFFTPGNRNAPAA